jgi:two-component system sensor histidine kinase PilS (NtrC family)
MPVIMSSAMLLYRRGSLLMASACSLSYGIVLDLQYFGWIAPLQIVSQAAYARDSGTYFINILMNIAGFYLVGFLSGSLAEELQRSSRQVRAQELDLHNLETLHHNIVESINSGLLTVGEEGRIIFSNNAAHAILELGPEQIEGRHANDFFPRLDLAGRPCELPAPKRNGSDRMEAHYCRPSGEGVYLGYTVSRLSGSRGGPSGWIVTFQDLTQVKAMEEHMQRMERLVFAGRMAAEIAHEIKNPLAAMSGAVQMLQEDGRGGSLQARLMTIVQREIDRINVLVTDFLWLARGARKSEQVEQVSICAVIQEILTLLRARNQITSSHAIRTVFDAAPVSPLDPHHLRQILWNLLVNALEAMPEGGELGIRVAPEGSEGCLAGETRIDIEDTGCGIPAEVRPKIFEPFFTTKGNGTGLGLSIVYQLVGEAGGRVEVSSHKGGGTVFSLFFPSSVPF